MRDAGVGKGDGKAGDSVGEGQGAGPGGTHEGRHILEVDVSPAEFEKRRSGWRPPPPRYERGALAKYARLVGSASSGAVCD